MKRKVIRTEADLLEHSYGRKSEAKPEAPPAAPPPAASEPEESAEPASDAEALVAKFVDDYTKDELISLAEDNDIDSGGVKADIAARLVEAGWAPEE